MRLNIHVPLAFFQRLDNRHLLNSKTRFLPYTVTEYNSLSEEEQKNPVSIVGVYSLYHS